MGKFLPKSTANARKLAKISRLERLVDDAISDLWATWPADEMKWWKIQRLQEVVDAEIDSTYRQDEVLWYSLFLARREIPRARNADERRYALAQYEAAKFAAIAWPYDDAAHSRWFYGRYF